MSLISKIEEQVRESEERRIKNATWATLLLEKCWMLSLGIDDVNIHRYNRVLEEIAERETMGEDENFLLRHITFTCDPDIVKKPWSDDEWEEIMTSLFTSKKTAALGHRGVVEHHKDGRKHCHVLAVYCKANFDKKRGLNKSFFQRYYKSGNIKVTKPNYVNNPNSNQDMNDYLDKEIGAHRFETNWVECKRLLSIKN